ncbi:hypothetical protein BKA65DRAFT_173167 [Rhexocercosporidium sp. MPI-PUGE-AT-0058]|nr:hypothetical protein BKA65DRAFT_173167 [Rhexocercosporidium sp. MPI-PUGE-AT-0058]
MIVIDSRITFGQFHFVVMGCIFSGWNLAPGWEGFECTLINGIRWTEKVSRCFYKDNVTGAADSVIGNQPTSPPLPYWLHCLHSAGQTFVRCENQLERSRMRQLFRLGVQKREFWLPESDQSPFFGLSLRSVMRGLLHKSALEEKVVLSHESTNSKIHLTMEEAEGIFMQEVDVKKVTAYFRNLGKEPPVSGMSFQSLQAFAAAAKLYEVMPDARVSLLLLDGKPFSSYQWCIAHRNAYLQVSLSRTHALSCISMFDCASDIHPDLLEDVFAISSGDSIYIAAELLLDPSCTPHAAIRRLTGNIGRPGLSLLIAPPKQQVRTPGIDSWASIQYAPFNGRAEDWFKETSLHMSFGEYNRPLQDRSAHRLGSAPTFIETILSVYDRGRWVADLDVLGALDAKRNTLLRVNCAHSGHHNEQLSLREELVSIDSWNELLEAPAGNLVIRASGNAPARLAATVLSVQLGYETLVLPDEFCWACCCAILNAKSGIGERPRGQVENGTSGARLKAIILGSRMIDGPQNRSTGIDGSKSESATLMEAENLSTAISFEDEQKSSTSIPVEISSEHIEIEDIPAGTSEPTLQERIELKKSEVLANLQLALERRGLKSGKMAQSTSFFLNKQNSISKDLDRECQ